MLDQKAQSEQSCSFDAEASLGLLAAAIPCPGCQFDLSRLPAKARFCPRCGQDLQAPISSASAQAEGSNTDGRVTNEQPRSTVFPITSLPPLTEAFQKRSPILRGFARALYRLGRRYERGMGVQHNPDEALRCYFKAAKLGDPGALARLSGVPVGKPASEQSGSGTAESQ